MKILVTNDDGIYARGLWSLVRELTKVGEVIVVAPDREQSAIGTAVTLHQPLRFSQVTPLVKEVKAYMVEGTPADSVILALELVAREEIGIVFSGINEGANLGDDVLLSGTVGAALQGYFRNIPAIALSVMIGERMHYEVAARLGFLLATRISASPPSQGILLNVNLPNLPLSEIKGVEVTRLACRSYRDSVEEGFDGKRKYYWIVRGEPQWKKAKGTDIWAVEEGKISLTPLHPNPSPPELISLVKDLASSLAKDLGIPPP